MFQFVFLHFSKISLLHYKTYVLRLVRLAEMIFIDLEAWEGRMFQLSLFISFHSFRCPTRKRSFSGLGLLAVFIFIDLESSEVRMCQFPFRYLFGTFSNISLP